MQGEGGAACWEHVEVRRCGSIATCIEKFVLVGSIVRTVICAYGSCACRYVSVAGPCRVTPWQASRVMPGMVPSCKRSSPSYEALRVEYNSKNTVSLGEDSSTRERNC